MELHFSPQLGDGYLDHVIYWKIIYYPGYGTTEDTDYPYDPEHYDPSQYEHVGKLELPDQWIEQRSNLEYNSPIINNELCGHHHFKIDENTYEDRPGGWYQFNYDTGKVLKVYKPVGCKSITVYGIYDNPSGRKEETQVTYEFSEEQTKYSMVISYANNSEDICAEGYLHQNETPYYSINKFYIPEHLTQINGSNFCVSKHEYLESNKSFINGLKARSIPEFQNFALSRTFQKFFIGGYEI